MYLYIVTFYLKFNTQTIMRGYVNIIIDVFFNQIKAIKKKYLLQKIKELEN